MQFRLFILLLHTKRRLSCDRNKMFSLIRDIVSVLTYLTLTCMCVFKDVKMVKHYTYLFAIPNPYLPFKFSKYTFDKMEDLCVL